MVNVTDDIFFFSYPPVIDYWPLVLVILGTAVSGVLIGAIGVGGVAIVPMLLFFGVDGKIAVTSAMFAYIWVAVSAITVHGLKTKFSPDNARQLTIICLASFPTAILAGYVLTLMSAEVAVLICATVALATSVKSIVEFAQKKARPQGPPCCGVASGDGVGGGAGGEREEVGDDGGGDDNGDDGDDDDDDDDDVEAAGRPLVEPSGAGARHHENKHAVADASGTSRPYAVAAGAGEIHKSGAVDATGAGESAGGEERGGGGGGGAGVLIRKNEYTQDGAEADEGRGCECCSATAVDSVVFSYVGLITGFGSGLTGTSGPVVALPQLFLTRPRLPSFMAVAFSVVVQLPVALGSTVGNLLFGQLDLGLGVLLGFILAVACPFGVAIAKRLNDDVIKLVVSVLLVVAAVVLYGNTIPKMLPAANQTAST